MMELFDYQQEMVERVQKAFRKHQSVMAQMPTGTGKTYLLAAVVKSEEQRVKNPCVWIVAHRRELVAQIIDTLKRFSLSPDSTNIKVMSIQWLTLHYLEMKEMPSLIVIDEAHHAVAKTYAEVMRAFPKAKKLGLTIAVRLESMMRCRKELTRYGMYPRTCLARVIGWMAFPG